MYCKLNLYVIRFVLDLTVESDNLLNSLKPLVCINYKTKTFKPTPRFINKILSENINCSITQTLSLETTHLVEGVKLISVS